MNFVAQLVGFFARYRITFFAIVFVLFALDLFFVSGANFSENIYDILPKNDELIDAHTYVGKKFNKANTLFFSIANIDETSPAKVEEFANRLSKIKGIKSVSAVFGKDFDVQAMVKFLPLIFDADIEKKLAKNFSESALNARFSALKKGVLQNNYIDKFALKNDPLNIFGAFSDKLKKTFTFNGVVVENFMMFSPDKRAILVLATGEFDCADSSKSTKLVSEIDNLISTIQKQYPQFKIAYAGGYRVSAENAKIAKTDSTICLLLTIFVMSIICFVSFRNRFFWFFAIVPSLIGSAVAFCVVCFFFEKISSISIAFASIAIGVSIDYAIHVSCFADTRLNIFKLEDAVCCAKKYLRPISVVAGTTAIAFVLMCFLGSLGFVQLGVFGLVGIIVSAFVSVFVMPVFLIGRKLRTTKMPTIIERIAILTEKFSTRKISIFVAVVVSIFAAMNVEKVKFNGDVSTFNILGSTAKSDSEFIKKVWSGATSTKCVLLRSDNLNSLLLENEKLKTLLAKNQSVKSFGIQNLFVSKQVAQANLVRWQAFLKKSDIEKSLKNACENSKIRYVQIRKNIDWIFSVQNSCLTDFYSAISKMAPDVLYVGEGECALISSFNADDSFNPFDFQKKLSSEFDNAFLIDQNYLGEHIADISFAWLWKFALVAFVLAGVYLYFALKSLKAVIVVLLPVVLGLFWCFGFLGCSGIQINIINSVFVIFAVCLAQDYAVFVLNATENKMLLRFAFAPILLSALTTIFAFGILCVSVHPVIYGLGAVSAMSIFSILCAVICIGVHISKWILKNDKK